MGENFLSVSDSISGLQERLIHAGARTYTNSSTPTPATSISIGSGGKIVRFNVLGAKVKMSTPGASITTGQD
jgi:hypothetical protein